MRTNVLLGVWASSLWTGVLALGIYQSAPGRDVEPPQRLPASFAVAEGKASLWMVMHPECPCTEASLAELTDIVRMAGDRVEARVLLTVPEGRREEWTKTAYARMVEDDPRLELVVDDDGDLARAIGSATSGRVVLYDEHRTLRFHGGITPTRAHRGDSVGRRAILAALGIDATLPQTEGVVATSAFGCDLFGDQPGPSCCAAGGEGH
jgi:hypothetical protein